MRFSSSVILSILIGATGSLSEDVSVGEDPGVTGFCQPGCEDNSDCAKGLRCVSEAMEPVGSEACNLQNFWEMGAGGVCYKEDHTGGGFGGTYHI